MCVNVSTKTSIPFSQFLRLRRLCSDNADFKEKAEEMVSFFLQRWYPENMVKKAFDQIRPIQRQKTLQPNSKTAAAERTIMSLLYHPLTIRMRNIILSNWSLLQACTEVAKIFSWPPLIAYKCDTNIWDMSVRSKLQQPSTRTPGITPCNQEKCKTAPSSASTSASKDRNPRWTSPNSSTARHTTSCTLFIASSAPNSTSAKWDTPSTPASKNTWLPYTPRRQACH